MKTIHKSIILFGLLSLLAGAQISNFSSGGRKQAKNPDPITAFREIESGIKHADPAGFSKYLSENSYLSLPNGVTGYFSSNQSFYILKDFFKTFIPVTFSFTIPAGSKETVATGALVFESKGKRENATVYIALTYEGTTWRITQFMVN